MFFANDNDDYVEISVSPDGRYYVALHSSYVTPVAEDIAYKPILHLLPVESVLTENDCPKSETAAGVADRCHWNVTLIIPDDYLPKNVTTFNAYATHGAAPSTLREALFTQPNETSFHNLDNFGTINLASEANYDQSEEISTLWKSALSTKQDYHDFT